MIKKIIKSIEVAFSMYSKIPMPRFDWSSDDMKYHMCFFPWVGAVIGGILWGWYQLYDQLEIGKMMFVMIAIVIPVLVTGGIHIDGFMDTMDAVHSYQDKERKLEILKDPHIGAFSVICLVTYFLVLIGFLTEIKDEKAIIVLCFVFFLSRALSGISVAFFPPAKKSGMLSTSLTVMGKRVVRYSLIVQFIIVGALVIILAPVYGSVEIAMLICSLLYYYLMSKKNFGGITGDLAGFFVVVAELMSVIGVVVAQITINL